MVAGRGQSRTRRAASVDWAVAGWPATEALFPRAIVAGCDGSPESEAAVAVARHLADRFGASLSVVTALGGKDVDQERARALGAISR